MSPKEELEERKEVAGMGRKVTIIKTIANKIKSMHFHSAQYLIELQTEKGLEKGCIF